MRFFSASGRSGRTTAVVWGLAFTSRSALSKRTAGRSGRRASRAKAAGSSLPSRWGSLSRLLRRAAFQAPPFHLAPPALLAAQPLPRSGQAPQDVHLPVAEVFQDAEEEQREQVAPVRIDVERHFL